MKLIGKYEHLHLVTISKHKGMQKGDLLKPYRHWFYLPSFASSTWRKNTRNNDWGKYRI